MNNHKKSNRAYYQRNKEEERAKRGLRYQQHSAEERAKARVSRREYRSRHPELKEKRKLYIEHNRDKINETQRAWREKNKETYNEYQRSYSAQYRQINKEKIEATRREWRRNLRVEVLTYYGNGQLKCVSCNENRLPCLTIDHINNEGAKERREIRPKRNRQFSGMDFYSWLKQHKFPLGYQTLCMNCQWVKKADYERL